MLNATLANPLAQRPQDALLEDRVQIIRELERRPGAEEGTWEGGDGGVD